MGKITEEIKYDKRGLIPAVVQSAETDELLMLAYMNEESLNLTLETGYSHFFSRSRNKLWKKGESSGNVQLVKDILLDCDNDSILLKVYQKGPACHKEEMSCFHNKVKEFEYNLEKDNDKVDGNILKAVYDVVIDRLNFPKEGSYTNYLFNEGIDKILKKVGEESAEVIIASKNRDKGEVIYEVSDLLYHLIVLLVEQGIDLESIFSELDKRR